ncbi:MAG: hypothetical protein JJD92_12415 [Frankiaceae bacterium]|nr:hypothetical protein [Frankiaceae bacterium]
MTDAAPPLPLPVVEFVRGHISSLLQLEALLLVFETGGRPRSVAQLAAEMYVPSGAVADWLDDFCAHGFCERVDEGYRMADDQHAFELLSAVADCYMRRRISLGRLIFSPRYEDPRGSFSDAFRIRRER